MRNFDIARKRGNAIVRRRNFSVTQSGCLFLCYVKLLYIRKCQMKWLIKFQHRETSPVWSDETTVQLVCALLKFLTQKQICNRAGCLSSNLSIHHNNEKYEKIRGDTRHATTNERTNATYGCFSNAMIIVFSLGLVARIFLKNETQPFDTLFIFHTPHRH